MKISFCCPSYRRPKVETLDYLPYVKVFVDHKEYDDYVAANPKGAMIVSCPEGVQGNVSRIRNYILRTEFEAGADAVVLMDDDVKYMAYWEKDEPVIISQEIMPVWVEKYIRMCKEMGFYLWGVNLNTDKWMYKECTPFSTVSVVLGPFGCFLKPENEKDMCWYDERISLKEDYDMSIQHCKKHRGLLRVNKAFYNCKQSIQPGGCAVYRNVEREKQQFDLLQKKWGAQIVKRDRSTKRTKKKKAFEDYNPVIYIPIKGV